MTETTDFDIIESFSHEFRWLSNFYPLNDNYLVTLVDDIIPHRYATVEHAYQAAKFTQPDIREMFARPTLTPGQAKRLGRKHKIRDDWEEIKIGAMTDLVRQKFLDPALKELLLMTGNTLIIEGNKWHDNFWGDCSCDACEGKLGANHLGTIIMEIRNQCS